MRRLIALAVLATLFASCGGSTAAGPDRPVRILSGEPTTLDPAAQGDAGSAAITAQLFESLTAFDADLQVRPALAESWDFADGGRQVTFHLRPNLTFSDGSPLRPSDVVRSWLRLIDPDHPSPAGVARLRHRRRGGVRARDVARSGVGRPARRRRERRPRRRPGPARHRLRQHRRRPELRGRPARCRQRPGERARAGSRVRRQRRLHARVGTTDDGLELTANARYWAGKPAISTIDLVADLGGRGSVDAFAAGDLDYAPVAGIDATWLAYDETLGPQLRLVDSLSVQYYGFDTRQKPFDDPLVRRAFGEAVDWRRMAALGGSGRHVPGRELDGPAGDPRTQRRGLPAEIRPGRRAALLAEAGYPGGAGFPTTILMTGGSGYDEAIVTEVKRELGITLQPETMGDGYFDRLSTDPPAMWSLAWVADYPGRNDFLGVLLGTGATNNYGHWSSPAFDAAIAEAVSATDPAAAAAAYDRAEAIVRDEVPVVPVSYGPGWALTRTGLLGAGQNGLGIVRMAGLAWAD